MKNVTDTKFGSEKIYRLEKIWLGLMDLFQTFEELDDIKNKVTDIKEVRQLMDEVD